MANFTGCFLSGKWRKYSPCVTTQAIAEATGHKIKAIARERGINFMGNCWRQKASTRNSLVEAFIRQLDKDTWSSASERQRLAHLRHSDIGEHYTITHGYARWCGRAHQETVFS